MKSLRGDVKNLRIEVGALRRELNDWRLRERNRGETLLKWQIASKAVEGLTFPSVLNGVLTSSHSLWPSTMAGTSSRFEGVKGRSS